MCLLVPVEAGKNSRRLGTTTPISLQSLIIKEDKCQAGNLLQIYLNRGRTQARCNGTSKWRLTTSKSQFKRPWRCYLRLRDRLFLM